MKLSLLAISAFIFAAHLINAQATVTVTVTVDRLTMTDVVSAADPTSQLAVPTDAPTTAEAFTTETLAASTPVPITEAAITTPIIDTSVPATITASYATNIPLVTTAAIMPITPIPPITSSSRPNATPTPTPTTPTSPGVRPATSTSSSSASTSTRNAAPTMGADAAMLGALAGMVIAFL